MTQFFSGFGLGMLYTKAKYIDKIEKMITEEREYRKTQTSSDCIVKTVYVNPCEETETPAQDTELVSLGEFKLTAYCPCMKCCGKTDGITATGTQATEGRTIAVDPSLIPYGTEVIIDGHTYIAEDCGGAIKNKRIDIFFETHEAALNFGVQYSEVFIKG